MAAVVVVGALNLRALIAAKQSLSRLGGGLISGFGSRKQRAFPALEGRKSPQVRILRASVKGKLCILS